MAAAELAREIITQSTPLDRPTPFALRIPTEIHPGYFEHVTITSPIRNGQRILHIQFPASKGARSLVYSVEHNLDGAVFCLTSFMLYGDGECVIEMKPVNSTNDNNNRTMMVGGGSTTGGVVDEQFTLAKYNLTPTMASSGRGTPRHSMSVPSKESQEEVYEQVKKIVGMLFCESGDDYDAASREQVDADGDGSSYVAPASLLG